MPPPDPPAARRRHCSRRSRTRRSTVWTKRSPPPARPATPLRRAAGRSSPANGGSGDDNRRTDGLRAGAPPSRAGAAILGGTDARVLAGLRARPTSVRRCSGYLRRRWPTIAGERWKPGRSSPSSRSTVLRRGRTPAMIWMSAGPGALAEEFAQLVRQLSAERGRPEALALHLDGPWGAGKTTVAHSSPRSCAARRARPRTVGRSGSSSSSTCGDRRSSPRRGGRCSPTFGAACVPPKDFWGRRLFDLRAVRARGGSSVANLGAGGDRDRRADRRLDDQGRRRRDDGGITTVVAFIAAIGVWARGSSRSDRSGRPPARAVERQPDGPGGRADPLDPVGAERPILLVLDDLDRCNQQFAVELLDAVQTLLRTPSSPKRTSKDDSPANGHAEPKRLPVMVVLAVGDRRWLRAAYEEAYATFSPYVSEPGRPLGPCSSTSCSRSASSCAAQSATGGPLPRLAPVRGGPRG